MKSAQAIQWWQLAAYGVLGLPLAMCALPVYVQIPAYYSTQLGLAVASTGWVLFLARLFDTLLDPWLGRVIDGLSVQRTGRWFYAAAIILSVSFTGLWLAPVMQSFLAWWLALMLVLAYSAHSMLSIAYLAWGARLAQAQQSAHLLGASLWREIASLFGVILASVIPAAIISTSGAQISLHLSWFSWFFGLILLTSVFALLRFAPPWQRAVVSQDSKSRTALPRINSVFAALLHAWNQIRENSALKALLLPYFINAVSVSIPATLALFFIRDRLHAEQLSAAFLSVYFVAALLGLPVWVALAKRIGAQRSWCYGMALAIIGFIGAGSLSEGDQLPYFAVCVVAGFALGADLCLPPVLLAQVIPAEHSAAAYFGIWTLLGKLALALAGLSLPLLALTGYQAGQPAGYELAWVYAGLPCLLKFIALLLVRRIELAVA